MKFESITHTERLNTGNYNHLELTVSAKLEEGEDIYSAIIGLKNLVKSALAGKMEEAIPAKSEVPVTYNEETGKNEPAVEEVKEKKTRAKKTPATEAPISTEGAIEPVAEVKEEPKSASKKVVKYSRAIDAHKTLLSSTLTTNFPNWKTSKPKEEIVAFTTSLEGKDFVDEDGIIVESFKQVLSGFFA